eukprot:4004521-Pyramimonas_sp.AAC.1
MLFGDALASCSPIGHTQELVSPRPAKFAHPNASLLPAVEAQGKKHPACLQDAMGLLGFDGLAMDSVTLPRQTSMDAVR